MANFKGFQAAEYWGADVTSKHILPVMWAKEDREAKLKQLVDEILPECINKLATLLPEG